MFYLIVNKKCYEVNITFFFEDFSTDHHWRQNVVLEGHVWLHASSANMDSEEDEDFSDS